MINRVEGAWKGQVGMSTFDGDMRSSIAPRVFPSARARNSTILCRMILSGRLTEAFEIIIKYTTYKLKTFRHRRDVRRPTTRVPDLEPLLISFVLSFVLFVARLPAIDNLETTTT